MSKELILVGDVLDAEIAGGNLPVTKGEKPKKSNPTGIDIRTNQDGTKTYYILYRHNSKLIREKVGKDSEGITLAYCKKFRGERISLKNHGDLAPSEIKKAKIKTSIKLNDIAVEYLAEIAHLSDGKTTEGRYNNHLFKPFGAKSLDEITKDDIEIFRAPLKTHLR